MKTLQVHTDSFTHNGTKYWFQNITGLVFSPHHDALSFNYRNPEVHVRIQSEHTSALLLGYARWLNNL